MTGTAQPIREALLLGLLAHDHHGEAVAFDSAGYLLQLSQRVASRTQLDPHQQGGRSHFSPFSEDRAIADLARQGYSFREE